MKLLPICLIASLSLAGVAAAHQGVKDAKVKAWMHSMSEAGQASKTLGNMAKGSASFDAAQAAAAKATLIEVAANIPVLFETEASDPVSEALPAIWENFDDFASKADAMKVAAEALDASSADGISAGIRALGRSCGGCHRTYRK